MNNRWQSAVMRLVQLQPQRAIAVLALLVALVLCLLVANDLRRDYLQQILAAQSRTASLTQLLEEHARQSLRRVELAMSLAAQEVHAQAGSAERVTARTGMALRALLPQDLIIASYAVLDKSGATVASSLTEDTSAIPSAQDSDFFQAQQDPAQDGLFVAAPRQSPVTGKWIVPVSMRLTGDFDGYLVGSLDPDYFVRLYQSIDTGQQGYVALFNERGWAIAHWPFTAESAGRNWKTLPFFHSGLAFATGVASGADVFAGGPESLYSFRALNDYPLLVALGVSKEETLAPWRQRLAYEGASLAVVLLFLGAATVGVMAQLRRRLEAESARKLSDFSVLKSSLPTLWIGPDARILRVNQAACELHGLSEAQMLAATVMDLNPSMRSEKWPAHWSRLRAERNMRFETVHRHQSGADIPLEAELNFIEFEGQEYNFAFLRDLTLRKQADLELQRSAATLRDAIDAVDEAFVLFDADDRLVYCNAKYSELYPSMNDVVVPGARFEDMIRVGAERGLYRDSIGREEEWIAERMKAHRTGSATRIQKRDDGRVLRVIDRRTPEGYVVGIRVDITEMVQATEAAQEASRFKSQFLANMSHEIRTPMNAILGLLALLQKTELQPVQRDYAAKTTVAAQSLLGLLNDILDFSKVEAGKMELDVQAFRLDQMLRDIAVILSANVGSKPVDVLFDMDAKVPAVVVADAMRLQQVLVNLGGNAIKFTDQGQVVLRVRNVTAAPASTPPQCLLEFSIQDSGIGIAADKQELIFSGFSQAEASTTRRFGGTGLGLAICKRLVELMGGTLQLQSAPGQGSTFRFTLPLPVAPEAEGLIDIPRLSHEPRQVLVVDDNPVAREIVASMTRSWSWPTECAAGGQQALEAIRARLAPGAAPFDLIYLDWQMPGMDGWETLQEIRALCTAPALQPRVVMLSTNGRDTLNNRTPEEQAMVDGLLVKPVTPSALQDAALGVLPRDGRMHGAQGSSNRPLAGMRILVVEDNLINQQVAEELLGAEGARVSMAANGQLGVDAVAASQPPFDVVLMDVQMPVLDGYGATRKIRTELGMAGLPIVAMTANAMASDRQACLDAGMNDHVGKPFDMRHLVTVLLRVTGSSSSSEAAAAASSAPPLVASAPPENLYIDTQAAIDRLSGLTTLYIQIAQDFVASLDVVPADFQAAAQQGDWPALVVQMHTLKGTSATLGAQPLSDCAARLEKLFRNPPAALDALAELPQLTQLVQATRSATEAAVLGLQAQEESLAPPSPATPVHRFEAGDFLQQLALRLAASDLSALELYAQRGDALDSLDPARVEAIQDALQDLDLSAALAVCEAELQRMKHAQT